MPILPSKKRSALRSPISRSARCSIWAPSTGGCWSYLPATSNAASALIFDLDMLALARARFDRAGLKHCTVRHGDIYDPALPRDTLNVVVIHQVLHFLDDSARAIRKVGARVAARWPPVGDRLRAARSRIPARRTCASAAWLCCRNGDAMAQEAANRSRASLAPGPEGKIAVSLWLARDPRIVVASPVTREVA